MTARKRTPPDRDAPAPLFQVNRPRGAAERAMERSLADWRKDRTIDAAVSSALRSQAFAVDLARDKRDPWQVSNATRVLLELLQGFGLVTSDAAVDPFAELLDRLAATPVPDSPLP